MNNRITKALFVSSAALPLLSTGAFASADYGPAIWNPPSGCSKFYTTGNGKKFLVVHDMEGYYLSSVAYLRRCDISSSVHYCLNSVKDNSSDAPAGEITQLVLEANYAWHAGCWNKYSAGCEHEGFVSNPAWFTQDMYQNSASLFKHMAEKWGIAKDRNHIVGHGEKSRAAWCTYCEANFGCDAHCNSHTDPGAYWDWPRYMNIITGSTLNNRVGMDRSGTGQGYWIAASDGGVFSFGDAPFYGSMGGQTLNKPIVAICARKQGDGYWLAASDGGIFSFGAAPFQGSMGGTTLNQPVVGMASTQSGNGYWLVAKDGGIFNFGDAAFYGSLGSAGYTDIVGIAPAWKAGGSNGYRIVRSNGCTYDYNCGHLGGGEAGSGVKAICNTGTDAGFWEVGSGGAVFSYGNAQYKGGASESVFVGMARGPSGVGGYWAVKNNGAIFSFGDAPFKGGANF